MKTYNNVNPLSGFDTDEAAERAKARQNRIPLEQRPVMAGKSTRRYLKSKVTTRDLMAM